MLDSTSWRHIGHSIFFSRAAHPEQAHMCPQGCSTTLAPASQQMTHSTLSWTCVPATVFDMGSAVLCTCWQGGSTSSASEGGVRVAGSSARLMAASSEVAACICSVRGAEGCGVAGGVSTTMAALLAGCALGCPAACLACCQTAEMSHQSVRASDCGCSCELGMDHDTGVRDRWRGCKMLLDNHATAKC